MRFRSGFAEFVGIAGILYASVLTLYLVNSCSRSALVADRLSAFPGWLVDAQSKAGTRSHQDV